MTNNNNQKIFVGLIIVFVVILFIGLGGIFFGLRNKSADDIVAQQTHTTDIVEIENSLADKEKENIIEKIREEILENELEHSGENENRDNDIQGIDSNLFFASYADEIEENASTMPDGEYIEYYETDKIRIKTNYKNGELEGEFISYHENGNVWEKRNYKNGKRDGNWKVYTVDGLVLLSENYTNGVRNGEFIWRVPKNSHYEIDDPELTPNLVVASYDSGNLEYYNSESEISSEINKIGGKGNYEEISNYKNGNIAKKNYYRNKILEGKYESYYENGLIKEKSNYKNGKLEGEYIFYYEDGSIKEKENYKNGELYGDYILYDSKGNIQEQGNYTDEQEDETGNTHIENTSIDSETDEEFSEGKNVTYFSNGKIHKEYNIKNGEFHGEYVEYYENGKVLIKGILKNGLQLGRWEIYDEDGELFVVEYYRDGIKMK